MRTFNKILSAAVLATVAAHTAQAQEETPSEGSVALGYVGTTGNTETSTFNTEVLYLLPFDNWIHNMKFQALGSRENSQARAERYYLEDKSDFEISENDYMFAKLTYTDDRFSGFDYQSSVAGGYGHYFYNRDDLMLETFGGFGYRQNAIIDGEEQGELIVSLGQNFRWELSESSNVTQSLVTEIGEDLTVTRFEIGLISNIIGQVATKLAFQARHASDVPPGTVETDTQTSVSLVYEF